MVTEPRSVTEIGDCLVQHFRMIHQTYMQDTYMCNEALQVEAIGFVPHQGQAFGIILTPWFMNLVLAPLPGHPFPEGRMGDKRMVDFPAGPMEFIIGEVPEFGRLDTSSLFSPVFDFPDHQTAHDRAVHVLTTLFAAKAPPKPKLQEAVSRRALLRGKFWGKS